MYASDIIKRNRERTLYANYLLKQQEFDKGISIRVEYQKGGSDYSYMTSIDEARATTSCSEVSAVLGETGIVYAVLYLENGQGSMNPDGFNRISFTGVNDAGYVFAGTLDDAVVKVPSFNYDFFFFGTNYGQQDTIYWSSNSALLFGPSASIINGARSTLDISGNLCPAVLLGNYDRRLNSLYVTYKTELNNYSYINILATFDDNAFSNPALNLTDNSGNLIPGNPAAVNSGKFNIRLIRQLFGNQLQWIEVRVVGKTPTSGYVGGQNFNYGQGNNKDSVGNIIDATKQSSYNITNGTSFLNPCGSTFAPVLGGPVAGTSFVFQSDSTGNNWQFFNNASIPI